LVTGQLTYCVFHWETKKYLYHFVFYKEIKQNHTEYHYRPFHALQCCRHCII